LDNITDWERNLRIKIRNLVQKASGQKNHWHDIDELVDLFKEELEIAITSVSTSAYSNTGRLLADRGIEIIFKS